MACPWYKTRNNGEDVNTGKGRAKGRHSDSSMKINPRGMKNENASQSANASTAAKNIIRKKVEPETTKYFLEISNLFDNKEIDLEDRSTICANALEETKGKELDLVTDGVISHTLQILVACSSATVFSIFLLLPWTNLDCMWLKQLSSH